jgi:glycosyltransferase involved in cell wall biosynthesis
MNLIQITPGAGGGYYCENCLRDAGLVRELRRRGHEALMVPLYLPPVAEGPSPADDVPIFFGGINVYLEQKTRLWGRLPQWMRGWLDARPLLRWAARRAGMTRTEDLGPPTLSMLRGEEGRQVAELEHLVGWLRERGRVDAVLLSNALLLGMARRMKEALGAPILCTLQDEDAFLDALPEPYRGQAWALLAERAADADAFLPVSRYYAGVMQRRLGLADERVHVVPLGVDVDDFAPAEESPDAPTVGYLGQQNPASGLDHLVEAYLAIRARGRVPGVRLKIAGGRTRGDEPYVAALRDRIAAAGADGDVEWLPIPDHNAKRDLLASLSVLSVPVREGLAFGLYVVEAAASGVPVVEPRAGALEELVEATGGGVLVPPDDPDALADAIEALLLDPERARALGRAGREAVRERFTVAHTADGVLDVVEAVRAGAST